MALLNTIQECSRLGQAAVVRPYATIPYLSGLLKEVNTLSAVGGIIRNSSYISGRPISQQPAVISASREWLHSLKEITTVSLFENDHISCTMFCLPPNRELPIHDHPMMHVLMQVLEGQLHSMSYDWAFDRDTVPELVALDLREERLFQQALEGATTSELLANSSPSNSGPSKATAAAERSLQSIRDGILQLRAMPNQGRHTDFRKTTPNSTIVQTGPLTAASGVQWTRPTKGGVLHSFKAKDGPVAFIDIITPPYYRHATLSIPCTYFEALIDGNAVGDRTVIRPLLVPPSLHMDGYTASYLLP